MVIPQRLREAAGLAPGLELEITENDGRIEIEAVPASMRLVERGDFLAAEVDGVKGSPLRAEEVRDLLEQIRR